MLRAALPVRDFYWDGEQFRPPFTDDSAPRRWAGRFALARDEGRRVTLARDRLGINKLFFALHRAGRVSAANRLIDLVSAGVPIEAVYSVPSGHALEIDLDHLTVTTTCRAALDPDPAPPAGIEEIARDIRAGLEVWFARLARRFGTRPVWVCLSGGLDSGLIAVLAREHFSDVAAYTYTFSARDGAWSEDAASAERLAGRLRIPFRLVTAGAEDVLGALEDAVCYGQDWRDFNVHCAIVNELLARAMRRDAEPEREPLILTGDLANELLADYTPVVLAGAEYYRLPRVQPSPLRDALVRGLDAGDREVGMFGRHGFDVIQPYGLVAGHYLRLPASFIAEPGAKQRLGRAISGDRLPAFVFERAKVRAQLGSPGEAPGILNVLAASGLDAAALRTVFCRTFRVKDPAFLSAFIRAGRYRSMSAIPPRRSWIDGYLAA